MSERTCCAFAVAVVFGIAARTDARSQDAEAPAKQDDVSVQEQPASPQFRDSPIIEPDSTRAIELGDTAMPAVPPRAPLVREGSFVTSAVGQMVRDEETGCWAFRPEQKPDDAASAKLFILLPCQKLLQMERFAATADLDVVFEMTGRVFVFDNRNFLLPLSAPLLERFESREAAAPASDNEAAEVEPDFEAADSTTTQSAQDVIDRIKAEVPLPRTLERPMPDGANLPRPDAAAVQGAYEEGSLITLRRGRLARNPAGGWRFIFDADASGLADPPMTLLPCLLFEKMRADSQNQASADGMLVTGQVFIYRSENYLLPTMYRIERHRRNIR